MLAHNVKSSGLLSQCGPLLKFLQSDNSSAATSEISSTAEIEYSQRLCEANALNGKDLLDQSKES